MLDVAHPEYPAMVCGMSGNLDGFYALDGMLNVAVFKSSDERSYALYGGMDGMQLMDVTNPYAPYPAGALHETPVQAGDGGDGMYELAAVRMSDHAALALSMYVDGRMDMSYVTNPYGPVRVGTIPAKSGAGQWPSVRASGVTAFAASDGRTCALLTGEWGVRIAYVDDPARCYAGDI